MTARHRLPNRRACVTFDLESQGMEFTCSYSRDADSEVREIFLRNHKASSMAGINASDASVLWSIARQYGVPFGVLEKSLMGPLATALDLIAEREP